MHAFRSHTCAGLNKDNVGETIRLAGWVHRVRDHGGVLFIDLRDHYGMTQVLADPDSPVFAEVEKVRSEWCIRIDGTVKARDPDLVNPKIPTGEVEVFIRDLEVLGASEELPLMVFGELEYPEETRLKYRFLDLRREKLQRNMTLRSDVVASIRKRMWDIGFREYQTPIITASSPEGARDFLVPSRLHPGKFYALPQAPQQFKQLIMVSGFDKYFQIAPCFRDEDPRADRSPDRLLPARSRDELCRATGCFRYGFPGDRGRVRGIRRRAQGRRAGGLAADPLSRGASEIRHRQAGPAQPDRDAGGVRTFRGLGLQDLCQRLLEQPGTEVRAIPAPKGGSRKFCDRMNAFAQKEGLPGMGYIFWRDGG